MTSGVAFYATVTGVDGSAYTVDRDLGRVIASIAAGMYQASELRPGDVIPFPRPDGWRVGDALPALRGAR